MHSVFGDESADQHNKKVFAVAGVLGDEHQWAAIRSEWSALTKGRIFHAADCEAGYGVWQGIAEHIRHRLHRDLTRLLANSGLVGWGVGIDLAGCLRAFPEARHDQPYYSCFFRTVFYLSSKAALFIPRDTVEFIFDSHPVTNFNSGVLYRYMVEQGNWQTQPVMKKKISFASRQDIGIQIADLWAREVMKRLDEYLRDSRSIPRLQWSTLRDSKRFGADFQVEEYFQDLKRQIVSASGRMHQAGRFGSAPRG